MINPQVKYRVIAALFLYSIFLSAQSLFACDLCAIYNSVESQEPSTGSFRLGVVEQFTEFGTLRDNGHKIENENHERISSSITQLISSYDFSDRFGIQVSLPYINRRFTKLGHDGLERGAEAGIGDLSILGRYLPYHYHGGENIFHLQVIAGIRLPTGDSDRLSEEIEEHHEEDHDEARQLRHGSDEHAGSVHGHDLALGFGSVDFPIGLSALGEMGRFFVKASTTYTMHTEGDHGFRHGNDFLWDIGPAYNFHLDHSSRVALRAAVTGETKERDKQNGETQSDSRIRSVFLGPEIIFSIQNSLSGEIAYDIPIDMDNSGVQLVPSYRVRAGITYRF